MLHGDGGTSATTRLLGNTHWLLLILQSGAKPKASHKPGRVGRRRENDASRIFGHHCPGRIDKLRICPRKMEVRSINASVKLEEMIYGHLRPSHRAQRQIQNACYGGDLRAWRFSRCASSRGPRANLSSLGTRCRASAAGPTQLSFYGPPVSTTPDEWLSQHRRSSEYVYAVR